MSTPRLVILTPDFPPAVGGIQTMLYQLARGLEEHWDVVVSAPKFDQTTPWDGEQPFRVIRTAARWGGVSAVAVLVEMMASGLRASPDVVLAGHLLTAPSALVAARGRPTAVMLYGSELWAPRVQSILSLVRRRISLFIAISRFTARVAEKRGIPADRIRVVYPAAEPPSEPANSASRLDEYGLTDPTTGDVRPYLLTVARLAEPHKGQDNFIRTLPAILARYPQFRYVIAGDGPLRSYFERVAIASGVRAAVVMTGNVDEATKGCLIRNSRAFVMLSREAPAAAQFEGFGLVFLEAALAGRPSLAGASGGIPEVIVDGETGMLVNPSSSIAIADAAISLMANPKLADQLGSQARFRAESEFTWTRTVAAVHSELVRLLK